MAHKRYKARQVLQALSKDEAMQVTDVDRFGYFADKLLITQITYTHESTGDQFFVVYVTAMDSENMFNYDKFYHHDYDDRFDYLIFRDEKSLKQFILDEYTDYVS